jgi:hypothetical protein
MLGIYCKQILQYTPDQLVIKVGQKQFKLGKPAKISGPLGWLQDATNVKTSNL